MKDLSELEFYGVNCENLASAEDFDFYHDELVKIRNENEGIIIAWIVPDEGEGHVEYECFNTWDDAKIWFNQK
jgi:hypothetical protein